MANNHHLGLRRPAQHTWIEEEYFQQAFWGIRHRFNAMVPTQPLELAHWKIALELLFLASRESWDACSLQPSHGYYFVEGRNPCSRKWDQALVREEREAKTGAWDEEIRKEQRERDNQAHAQRSSESEWRRIMREQDPNSVFSIEPAPRDYVSSQTIGWREIMQTQDPDSVFSIEPAPKIQRSRSKTTPASRIRRDRSEIRAPAAEVPNTEEDCPHRGLEETCDACQREIRELQCRCRQIHKRRDAK
jgi:hypothetical protein